MPHIEPFIRWAGGKTWLVPFMAELTRDLEYKNYYEPFLGGAAVFFSLTPPKHAYLSDINPELIDTYMAIRDIPNDVIQALQLLKNTEEDYYRIRKAEPTDLAERAARFLYLNQTSFNGLYRVNNRGEYNVPYGYRKKLNYDMKRIRNAGEKLQGVRLECSDFAARKYCVKAKDLVFLDPPYTVSHNQNGFIKYNQNLFSIEEQYRLSAYIDYIRKKGAYYVLTNAAHEKILEIFNKGDRIITLNRNSLIGGKNSKREKISEYIFTNIPEGGQSNE